MIDIHSMTTVKPLITVEPIDLNLGLEAASKKLTNRCYYSVMHPSFNCEYFFILHRVSRPSIQGTLYRTT
jgi:hypothetical protein